MHIECFQVGHAHVLPYYFKKEHLGDLDLDVREGENNKSSLKEYSERFWTRLECLRMGSMAGFGGKDRKLEFNCTVRQLSACQGGCS